MKYLKLFNTHNEYVEYSASTSFAIPNVSWCVEDDEPHCVPLHIPYSGQYLTFDVLSGGTIMWKQINNTSKTIQYSINEGEWTEITSTDSGTPINVSSGDKVRFKGNNTRYATGNSNYSTFSGGTAYFNAEGNIMSLIGGDDFEELTSFNNVQWVFDSLFYASNVVSAENLIMPVMSLTNNCYRAMFNVCTSLIKAPELPATTLASDCYNYMFYGCTSLTEAPELMATTLAERCCQNMFLRCRALTTTPSILPATTLANYCYDSMFRECDALTTVPELPATTLTNCCYQYMFADCKSLIDGPTLLATTLAGGCYSHMFQKCSKLMSITCLATDISASNCTTEWMLNVATSGTFVKDPSMSSWTRDKNGIPTNWNVVDGVESPTILCDGENVTITCATQGSSIYYRLEQSGNYTLYSTAIAITADTFVEAYSVLGQITSSTVSQNCIYNPVVLEDPIITCDGENVTITCNTQGSSIYYRLDQSGSYALYSAPIAITADTLVEAYSTVNGKTSNIVSENCEYDPTHHYEKDYLTFDVLSGGNIMWVARSNVAKTISYSKNGGSWTEITAASTGTPISVVVGDKVRFKGTNTQYATAKDTCSCFSGGTAYYNVEGNIMSLISGDDFSGLTSFNNVEWVFHDLFCGSKAVSAENLVLPVTALTKCCYRALFAGCAALTTAPSIFPATTLAASAYTYMFDKDSSLTKAPELPATALTDSCYYGMFHECKALTIAPDLLAPTVPIHAYREMFNGCSNLTYIKCLATSISASDATYRWTSAVTTSNGTFVKSASMSSWTTGDSGIPSSWTVQNDGVESPQISCDGEHVTITCNTPNAIIYYKLNNVGDFVEYIYPIEITADTVVSTYAKLDDKYSITVTETCTYAPIQLVAPTISCDGENVTIVCATVGSTIYYRLDGGSYTQYSSPIAITADTLVDAYSSLDGRISTVVTQNCEYNPIHHYENDYLTFRVTSGGNIRWNAYGSGFNKVIEYSINNGEWTSITASSTTYITVATNDVVRFRGTNQSYSNSKSNYAGFDNGGTATFNIEGNIMSLVYGDNFIGQTAMTGTYNFCSIFKQSKAVSAENLVLPVTTLTDDCYRAMFSKCPNLVVAPELPATVLATECYWYMFEECQITIAPDLNAPTLATKCYGYMFTGCTNLNYIKCLATSGISTANCQQWLGNVSSSGIFVKDGNATTWGKGASAIPNGWTVYDDVALFAPIISFDGFDTITITCPSVGATIYYDLDKSGIYSAYTSPITITADTFVETYSMLGSDISQVASQNCVYVSDVPFEASNRSLNSWTYNNQAITTPYSINAIDGHSSSYAKGQFNFETSFGLRTAQPTYLWFQHADQSAQVYIDNNLVDKHWGGYNAFFTDVSSYVHSGTNIVKVVLKNNEGSDLAPAAGDFNFNATLGNVKLFTSPYVPSTTYGYDGFHITSTVSSASATINVATNVPTGATVICTISGVNCNYTATSASTSAEMTFTTTITNPRLWNGTIDPYLYNVKLEIYHNNELYHRYERPYGLRYYSYVFNETVNGNSYTGFLLNGQPYALRGVCVHDDLVNKANALNDNDYTQEFNIISELGCNFLRLAHYPHPKEVYDRCDQLGIVVQTEAPWVNNSTTGMPESYWTHLEGQMTDMVNQHYNHPCIMFWGVGNEINASVTNTDDGKNFVKAKIEGYRNTIRTLMPNALVGYTVSHSTQNALGAFNYPTVDWVGNNLYVGWYVDQNSNNPTSRLNTSISNATSYNTPCAFSEYGCGGTQACHSDDFMTTTTRGNNARHDIEYQMWLHEGHIAAIKNFPQLMFSAQWQLFDIAVSNRNEGYTTCLDGVNASTDDELRRLNNKGLVERDHVTKKDTFYLYKAWWNTTDKFVHICGKNYTKTQSRTIKCYSNDGSTLKLYVNGTLVDTATATDNICTFAATNFSSGDVIRVDGTTTSDTFTFAS